ncbi:hypothetical protein PT974_07554 [Cladobotryum mycophilum]|uniref:HNH nuclease domain-containing protein n=1 Tax=Cladobotryum mycophilum TaxID=491253 RepID=A0ABR0SPY5_9HYPO
MASPHHRHQASLEQVIDFSQRPSLGQDQRDSAKRRFYSIVNHLEGSNGTKNNASPYNRPVLVRLTYEHARSVESQDNFMRAFFESIELSIEADEDIDLSDESFEKQLRERFYGFADYLVENFFLPLKASTRKTPQPSPVTHSAIQRIQGIHDFAGTPERLGALRGACLERDRHRCVISRKFDIEEAKRRIKKDGNEARDDDGAPLLTNDNSFDPLEVAHILPHSLTKLNANDHLDPSRQAALAILNMFDTGVSHLIEGTNIDRPFNALTLTQKLHSVFGNFDIFFQPVQNEPHTYRIDTFLHPLLIRDPPLPITRTLFITDTHSIDPPSSRLLAIHNAIAQILHLSAAGGYIDDILRDLEENDVREDGSTAIDRFVRLRLGGWLDGAVDTHG